MDDKDMARPRGPGSQASPGAATSSPPAGFDPSRLRLAIDRVTRALDLADYDSGHVITGDNVKISDIRLLLSAAGGGTWGPSGMTPNICGGAEYRASDSDGPRMAETPLAARGEAGPARAEGIAQPQSKRTSP